MVTNSVSKQHNAWLAHISPTCPWASDPSPSPCQKINYTENISGASFPTRVWLCIHSCGVFFSIMLSVLCDSECKGRPPGSNLYQLKTIAHTPPVRSWMVTVGLHPRSGSGLRFNSDDSPNDIHLLWAVYIHLIILNMSASGLGLQSGL